MKNALIEFIQREIKSTKKQKSFLIEAPDAGDADMDQPGMKDLADSIQAMVQDLSLEEVSEVFSVVFNGLEGGAEQMKSYEEPDQDPEPEEFETLYTPGAEGRPQVGFREELIKAIKEVLLEGEYHEFFDPVSMVTGDNGPAEMGKEEQNELEGAREFAAVFHEKYNDHPDPAVGSASDSAYEMSLSIGQFFEGTKT
tara:strand:+ start:570 stop:1160 length:591 start_codon:yes stop_codon:yes gene_type:complete